MSMFNNAMFDTIKDALTKQASNQGSSGVSDILRFEKGNTFIGLCRCDGCPGSAWYPADFVRRGSSKAHPAFWSVFDT